MKRTLLVYRFRVLVVQAEVDAIEAGGGGTGPTAAGGRGGAGGARWVVLGRRARLPFPRASREFCADGAPPFASEGLISISSQTAAELRALTERMVVGGGGGVANYIFLSVERASTAASAQLWPWLSGRVCLGPMVLFFAVRWCAKTPWKGASPLALLWLGRFAVLVSYRLCSFHFLPSFSPRAPCGESRTCCLGATVVCTTFFFFPLWPQALDT